MAAAIAWFINQWGKLMAKKKEKVLTEEAPRYYGVPEEDMSKAKGHLQAALAHLFDYRTKGLAFDGALTERHIRAALEALG
jgi:hypothetical protein